MSWRQQNNEPFELLSINKSEPPEGSQGKDWVRYQIVQGSNLITGFRQGTIKANKLVVEQIIEGLNERRSPKRGRVQLTQLKKASKSAG